MSTVPRPQQLKCTPLHALHLELGGKMVEFAEYEMPLHYRTGILEEHKQTRAKAGFFDISHMGQVLVTGTNAAAAVESLVPVDIVDLALNRQRYAFFTNAEAGILDDLMITNVGDGLMIVLNAACKNHDIAYLQGNLPGGVKVVHLDDRALIALQGPAAGMVMARLCPETAAMVFMTGSRILLAGTACYATRSGYTGEDGFEISVPRDRAEAVARLLLEQPEVAPVGLGARDTLRLEAGLCLYGHDIDASTTPVEASLTWALSAARRRGGARPHGYPGAAVIQRQIEDGTARKRVGIRPLERTLVRDHVELLDDTGRVAGKITSGSFGPTVAGPVAMAYVDAALAHRGTRLAALVRGKRIAVEVTTLSHVPHRYFRG